MWPRSLSINNFNISLSFTFSVSSFTFTYSTMFIFMQFKYFNTLLYIFLILFYIYNQHNVFHLHLNSFNMLALSLRFIVIISFIYNQYNFTCTHIYFLRTIIWTFVGLVSFCKIDFTVFCKLLFVSGIFTYVLTLLVFIETGQNIPFQNQPPATRQSTIVSGNL